MNERPANKNGLQKFNKQLRKIEMDKTGESDIGYLTSDFLSTDDQARLRSNSYGEDYTADLINAKVQLHKAKLKFKDECFFDCL